MPDTYKKYQQLDELTEFELDEEGNVVEKYAGPSIEEIELEIQKYREESEYKIKQKEKEADRFIDEGKKTGFQLIQESEEKAKQILKKANFEAEKIVERAKLENERMLQDTEIKVSDIEHEAWKKGYDAGKEIGYKEGQGEVRRLIDRLGTILGYAIDARERIIKESEKQIIDLILIIARKVIKDEIEERKEVVVNNLREALTRIKDREKIDIRVNFEDIEITTAHKNEIIKTMESLHKVNIYEDTRVDRGGVIIETDIGSIDARISSQLTHMEESIRDASPL